MRKFRDWKNLLFFRYNTMVDGVFYIGFWLDSNDDFRVLIMLRWQNRKDKANEA